MPNRTMLAIREAARRFDIDPRELYRLVDQGQLSGFRGDPWILVPEDEMEELVASGVELAPWPYTAGDRS